MLVQGKGMTTDSRRDFPIWVRNYEKLHEATTPIKVGGNAMYESYDH